MLWRVVEKRVVEVKLVDLAWAGLFSTQPRYSHFLNDKDYTWPKGAKGGELLSAEKDLEFLESSLGQHMTRTKVSQRKGKRRKGMFRKRSSTSDFLTFCQTWCRDRSGILRWHWLSKLHSCLQKKFSTSHLVRGLQCLHAAVCGSCNTSWLSRGVITNTLEGLSRILVSYQHKVVWDWNTRFTTPNLAWQRFWRPSSFAADCYISFRAVLRSWPSHHWTHQTEERIKRKQLFFREGISLAKNLQVMQLATAVFIVWL